MAWGVMLGMGEDERDYLLRGGRCKECGHFNALHYFPDYFGSTGICELPDCDCGNPLD